ncbi:MAG: sulfatase [Myxococcota bacterium]|nr:sulfatase [Myxococcota bacterium]
MRAANSRRQLRRLATAACVSWLAACAPAPPELRIVLITLDTLRADGLSATHMPKTHAFANRGLRFERFYAASSATQPTHATLFTGQHPWEHGVARNGIALDPAHETVAERLRAAGFATAAVVASFALDRRFALDQGFDSYEQEFEHTLVRGAWQGEPVEGQRFYGLAGPVVARAIDRLDALQGPKQFLWLHLFDPHEPYGDAAGGQRAYPSRIRQLASTQELSRSHMRYVRRLYDSDLAELDAALGPFFARLEADAGHIETHVLLTSDHGESFGEDGSFTHGYRVSPEQVHVPFVIVSPSLAPGARSDVAGSRDVARTLLGLAGVDTSGFAGRDLAKAASSAASEAFGMAGQFGTAPEMRTDGSEVDASEPRFFAAYGDALLTGDARRVVEDDRDDRLVDETRAAPARELFAEFDQQRRSRESPLLRDRETEDALRALGYLE